MRVKAVDHSLGLEAFGFSWHDKADWLDVGSVKLETSSNLILRDIQSATGQQSETAFCRQCSSRRLWVILQEK